MIRGIYIWHPNNETRYCIGEWDPARKSYKDLEEEKCADLGRPLSLEERTYLGAEYRIKQEIKSKKGTQKYTRDDITIDYYEILDFKFNKSSGHDKTGYDKEIHKNLVSYFGPSVQVNTEFFQLSEIWKNQKDIFIDAVKKTASNDFKHFNPLRPFNYSPRIGSQDEAIKKATSAFNNGVKKFLLGGKCRFGKTFTSYKISKELKCKTILIMTFRPSDTKNAWREDLNTHQDFKDYCFFDQDHIKEFLSFDGCKVLFLSFQKAKCKSEKSLEAFDKVKSTAFDMIIIDEDQIGAHRIENRDLVEELQKKYILVCTGTPELEIISNEFGDNFYKFDYIDEQKLKKVYPKDYGDMPQFKLYSFDVQDKFAETIIDKNGFSFSEMFAIENEKFKYPKSVNKFLDYISAQSNDGSVNVEDDIGIFANDELNLSHGLWKLPSIKACKLLKNSLEKHLFFSKYKIEVLPENDKSPQEIEKICDENNRTIWLTVMKNTVGVTVKNWTYTMSLYGSDKSSLSSYIQYVFRAGSPNKNKKEFYSFDFCPSRVLEVVDSFAVARCADRNNSNYQKVVAEVLNYLPVFAYNKSGKFDEMSPSELFKQISCYTTDLACKNLLKEEFRILEEFKDDIDSVDVNNSNITISKNEELKKLKVELNKQAKKSHKEEASDEMDDKDFFAKMFQAFKDIYSWVKYSDGVDDLNDFVSKLNKYVDEKSCNEFFGFSEDFIKSLLAVINSSKRNFGIVIEKFKTLSFKFAMADVPEELAERMIKKFDDYKNVPEICDGYCQGPSLLKTAKKLCPKAKLYAYVHDGNKRVIRQLEIELGKDNVNIIKDYSGLEKMKFIMNPPYDGNRHLKILSNIAEQCPDAEITNLSPIRWLQDPLAQGKKSSDYNKYSDVRIRTESLDVVSMKEAISYFNTDIPTDLGIYHITQKGGWDSSSLLNKTSIKVLNKVKENLKDFDINQKDGWRVRVSVICGGRNGGGGAGRKVDIITQKLIGFKDGMKDGKPWYDFYMKNQWSKETSEIPHSVKFDTEEEMNNFLSAQASKLGRWFYDKMVIDVHINNHNFLWLPDYKKKWTDEQLYKYFGLNDEEISEIEKAIK